MSRDNHQLCLPSSDACLFVSEDNLGGVVLGLDEDIDTKFWKIEIIGDDFVTIAIATTIVDPEQEGLCMVFPDVAGDELTFDSCTVENAVVQSSNLGRDEFLLSKGELCLQVDNNNTVSLIALPCDNEDDNQVFRIEGLEDRLNPRISRRNADTGLENVEIAFAIIFAIMIFLVGSAFVAKYDIIPENIRDLRFIFNRSHRDLLNDVTVLNNNEDEEDDK